MEAAFTAIADAMPMKVSEFTFNMLSLLERGEVDIAVHIEGEALSLKPPGRAGRGLAVGQPPDPDPDQDDQPPFRPDAEAAGLRAVEPHAGAVVPGSVRRRVPVAGRPTPRQRSPRRWPRKGSRNTADAAAAFWVPDWDFFVANKLEITDRLNDIFGL